LGKVARVAGKPRKPGVKKIGVQGNDHVRSIELVNRFNRLAKSHTRAIVDIVAINRLIDMPLRLRVSLQKRLQLVVEGWRGDCLGKNANPGTLQSFLNIQRAADCVKKLAPGAHITHEANGLRAVWVIQIKNGSLSKRIRPAQARRVQRISFDLGWPIGMAFDQY